MNIQVSIAALCFALSAPPSNVREPHEPVRSIAGGDAVILAQPLAVGAKVSLSASTVVALNIAVMSGGEKVKEFAMPGRRQLTCVASVTSADEEGCTAGELVFGSAKEVEVDSLGAAPKSSEPAFARQTFTVARGGSGFTIRSTPRGLSTGDRDTVSQVADATLGIAPLGAYLAGLKLRKGESIVVPTELGQRTMCLLTSDTKVRELRLMFAGESKQRGVPTVHFQATAKLATDSRASDLTAAVDLEGDFVVAKETGLILSITMTGPVKISAILEEGDLKFDLVGTGTWTMDYTARVE